MCNEVARRIGLGELREDFAHLRIPLHFPEGAPNMAPLDSVRITDPTVIVRRAVDGDGADAVTRRWSWPGAGGRPVYNYRSEGRDLARGRCLVPIDGFYEFTAPADPKAKRKDKWLFRPVAGGFLCVAGLWRNDATHGECFTLLTCEPGPDIAPYHSRQIVLMPHESWGEWLRGDTPSAALIAPTPAGTLTAARVATPATAR